MNPYEFGPEPWMADGVCRSVGGDLFFPEQGSHTEPAKRVCRGCPVMVVCRDYAVRRPELVGVWGATSGRQRERMRAVLGLTPRTPELAPHGTSAAYRRHYREDTPPCQPCKDAERLRRSELRRAS